MGVSVLNLNKELQAQANEEAQSDLFYSKHGYNQPTYALSNGSN